MAGTPGTVRILHTSDIHVGDSVDHSGVVAPLVDAALAHDVDVVLLVGDIFDHNRVPTEVGQALVDELARLDVPVVVLPGNHDCLVPDAVWRRVELPANVHVMTDADGRAPRARRPRPRPLGPPAPRLRRPPPARRHPGARRAALARRPRPRPPRAAARRPPPGLPDHARGDRRLGPGLHRPRPLGRAPRHERRRRHRPLLRLGQPLRRVRARHADRSTTTSGTSTSSGSSSRWTRLRLVDSGGCTPSIRRSAPSRSAACCARRPSTAPVPSRPPARSPPPQLRAVEDEAIAAAVRRVEELGMRSVTDGEFRRAWFHLDFLEQLDGVAVTGNIAASSDAADTVHMTPPRLAVVGPLRHVRDIQVDDFRYLASVVTQTPKVSIPSPTMVHFRGGRAAIDLDAYPDLEVFFADLADVLPGRARRAVRRRLPVRAARRHEPRLPLRSRDARRRRRAGRRSRRAAARLRRADQRGDRRPPRRPHGRHPPVPRQLPQHVVRGGRLRAGRRGAVRRARRRRLLPRVRRRALRRLRPVAPRRRPTRPSCSAS